ncbi:MAG: RsmE family RNA methyltransferase [Planctomycetes bacterium]|nr:RsmE family RNA methyltransferase [Planctomycetota bacterium]
MSRHRVHADSFPNSGKLIVGGEEAHHALRTRRLGVGDSLDVLDGRGRVADAVLVESTHLGRGRWTMTLDIRDVRELSRPAPTIQLLTGVPKGARLEALIDGASQAGATSWQPLIAHRSVVDPGPGKLERLTRVAVESGKQCGRPWFLEIQEPVCLPEALATVACFAGHPMRIETAAIVAVGVILDQERRAAPTVTQPVSFAEGNAP